MVCVLVEIRERGGWEDDYGRQGRAAHITTQGTRLRHSLVPEVGHLLIVVLELGDEVDEEVLLPLGGDGHGHIRHHTTNQLRPQSPAREARGVHARVRVVLMLQRKPSPVTMASKAQSPMARPLALMYGVMPRARCRATWAAATRSRAASAVSPEHFESDICVR